MISAPNLTTTHRNFLKSVHAIQTDFRTKTYDVSSKIRIFGKDLTNSSVRMFITMKSRVLAKIIAVSQISADDADVFDRLSTSLGSHQEECPDDHAEGPLENLPS